jgi:hypothetical protein
MRLGLLTQSWVGIIRTVRNTRFSSQISYCCALFSRGAQTPQSFVLQHDLFISKNSTLVLPLTRLCWHIGCHHGTRLPSSAESGRLLDCRVDDPFQDFALPSTAIKN